MSKRGGLTGVQDRTTDPFRGLSSGLKAKAFEAIRPHAFDYALAYPLTI
jgi:hypothetical protein